MREWRVSSSEREKRFSQAGKVQTNGFSPVWVRMWRVWDGQRGLEGLGERAYLVLEAGEGAAAEMVGALVGTGLLVGAHGWCAGPVWWQSIREIGECPACGE